MPSRISRPFPLRLTSLAALALVGTAAAAQTSTPQVLDTVLLTGTRAINRSAADSESPVDVISAAELKSAGSSELATVLARLLPSLNFPRPSVTDASDAIRPAQLRGLSPDQVLVLINGKRRHTTSIVNVNGSQGRGSSPVDLNAIPIDAIARVEVLRDGAAAQYGSDAIAGVVNIILRSGYAGGIAHFDAGQTAAGDGEHRTVAASTGLLQARDGWLRIAGEHRDQSFTNRAGVDLRDPKEPRYGQVNQRFGDPDSRAGSVLINGEWHAAEGITLYGHGQLSRRDSSAAATWRTAQTAVGSGVLRSTLYPQGFLPLEESRSDDRGLVLGLRSDAGSGWRWDVSLNHGRNDFRLDIANTANLSLGAASPTEFYAGRLHNEQTLLNADLARELSIGLAEPATLALGAEARRERYEIEAGSPDSYSGSGAQGFSGFRAANAGSSSRHSEAVYANLEAPISRDLSASLAWRAEHYSDFGQANALKASARWVAAKGVSLRATASSGFRAPSLAQQHYTITTTNFIVINGVSTPVETGTFAVGSSAALALGSQPLKAEKARNASLGLQLNPSRDLSVTLDAYQVDIDDRILFSANLVLPSSLQATLAAQGVLAGAARYFTNAVDTRTRGVDLVASWQAGRWALGSSDLTLAYNHNKNSLRRVADNPALLTANGLTLIDRQTIGRATVASPKDKLALSLNHQVGAVSLRAGATRYGSFTVPQNSAALDQSFGAAWVLDTSLSLRQGAWTFTLGADNLNNRYPDKVTSAGNLNTNGIFPFSSFSPFGFNGRQYYGRISTQW